MGHKLITQLVLITVSLIIIFTFVKPSFSEVATIQEDLFRYRDTVAKATEFNSKLRELVQIESSLSAQEKNALETFLPSKIDAHKVMRDIQAIFDQNGVDITSLQAGEEVSQTRDVVFEEKDLAEVKAVTYQEFDITFVTTYEAMRDVLSALESNAYLLEVAELSFSGEEERGIEDFVPDESDQSVYILTLRAYALPGLN